jgi:cytochrome bd-type quinol oxidase subunit 2
VVALTKTKIYASILILLTPGITLADSPNCCGTTVCNGILKGLPCDTPSSSLGDINILVNNILGMLLEAAGVLFIIMLIVGGITYISSAGNEKQADTAKKILTAAIVGLILTVLSTFIVRIFIQLLGGRIG